MKNILLAVMIISILVLAGCKSNSSESLDQDSGEITDQSIDIGDSCTESKLKTSSGNSIYSDQDAASQFGGSWKYSGIDEYTLKRHKTGVYCIFDFKRDSKEAGRPNAISIQVASQKVYNEIVDLDKYSTSLDEDKGVVVSKSDEVNQLKNLGDEAIISRAGIESVSTGGSKGLFLKKGSNYFIIGCVQSVQFTSPEWTGINNGGCEVSQLAAIGQRVIENMAK